MKLIELKQKYLTFFNFLENKKINYIYENELLIIKESVSFTSFIENNDSPENVVDILLPDNICFEQNVCFNAGYSLEFGNRTVIKGYLENINRYPKVKIKSLGNYLEVYGTIFLNNVYIGKFPDYFNIKNDLNLTEVTGAKTLGKKTIVDGSMHIDSNVLENLNDCNVRGKIIEIKANLKEFPKSLLNENHNKEISLYLDSFVRDHKINLPESFNNVRNSRITIYLNVLIENIWRFKTPNIIFHKFTKIYEDICNLDNMLEDKFNYINIYNVLNYMAPTKLHYKLLNNKIEEITTDEIKSFNDNRNKLENYCFFDKNNIILYCRSPQAINFLFKNNYRFNRKQHETIKDNFIKNLYEKELVKSEIIKSRSNIYKFKKANLINSGKIYINNI